MDETTRFELDRHPMGPAPTLSRRHRVAMSLGVAGILAAMTVAMATAAAAPRARDFTAPTVRAEVRR
jgi:hypothetical protein